jgi:hypothetical protein
LIVFGGDNSLPTGSAVEHNDTWVLTNANGASSTSAWIKLAPAGTLPTGRSSVSVSYDPTSRRLVVFGGINQAGSTVVNFGDTWVLTEANGAGGTPRWIPVEAEPAESPLPRYAYSMAYNRTADRLIVALGVTFGVSASADGFRDDLWILSGLSRAE